ncbi:CpaF family protein [Gardnerella vaginalis]|nr:ATPase, T2SS/T4P/T4SS family [Gardnerella vaginalis]MDK7191774.1 ATPase, T2SS/T4P/T4SS family [Bifidobacterium sp. UMB1197]
MVLQDIDFGVLQDLANNPKTTDIVVTDTGRVWVDFGLGLQEYNPRIPFDNPSVLREYAVWLCAQLGKRLDDACPIADASSPLGVRIHALIAPIVLSGAAISIRFPALKRYCLTELSSKGMFPIELSRILYLLVESRANILITGSTGSGKTTLMKALLASCNPKDRIVTVEETRELGSVSNDHVSLATREANVEGAGCIDLPDLVKATLRMRPDRIILGECRGKEIADLLRVFTCGHKGGMTTLHADKVQKVPARLMALGLLAGLEPMALCALAADAFDVVIHVERVNGARVVKELGLLKSNDSGALEGVPVLRVKDSQIETTLAWKDFATKWHLPLNSQIVLKA